MPSPSAGTWAFGSLFLVNALSAHETMSGNEPARIRDAASAAVESDLRRATTSEGSGSGMDRISREACCEPLTPSLRAGYVRTSAAGHARDMMDTVGIPASGCAASVRTHAKSSRSPAHCAECAIPIQPRHFREQISPRHRPPNPKTVKPLTRRVPRRTALLAQNRHAGIYRRRHFG